MDRKVPKGSQFSVMLLHLCQSTFKNNNYLVFVLWKRIWNHDLKETDAEASACACQQAGTWPPVGMKCLIPFQSFLLQSLLVVKLSNLLQNHNAMTMENKLYLVANEEHHRGHSMVSRAFCHYEDYADSKAAQRVFYNPGFKIVQTSILQKLLEAGREPSVCALNPECNFLKLYKSLWGIVMNLSVLLLWFLVKLMPISHMEMLSVKKLTKLCQKWHIS